MNKPLYKSISRTVGKEGILTVDGWTIPVIVQMVHVNLYQGPVTKPARVQSVDFKITSNGVIIVPEYDKDSYEAGFLAGREEQAISFFDRLAGPDEKQPQQ